LRFLMVRPSHDLPRPVGDQPSKASSMSLGWRDYSLPGPRRGTWRRTRPESRPRSGGTVGA
jgi:hypothetical protein